MTNQETRYYLVADHLFTLSATAAQLAQLPNYQPFQVDEIEANKHAGLFSIRLSDAPLPGIEGWEENQIDSSDADLPRIEQYSRGNEKLFRVSLSAEGEIVCAFRCTADYREAELYLHPAYVRFAVDNTAMLLYAFTTAHSFTLLFHASVTVYQGNAYLFLGHSGTGKSTHSQQWLKAFPEAWLLNDDNPVLRILSDETVQVFGSPWSGKTPCYKQANAPVGALVQLEQAPVNAIEKLKMTRAYPYILASVSGQKLVPEMMDALYASIASLLEKKPVFYLRCLPNLASAQLCAQTCLSSSCRTDTTL